MFLLMKANGAMRSVMALKGELVMVRDIPDFAEHIVGRMATEVSEEDGKAMIACGTKLVSFPNSDVSDIQIPVVGQDEGGPNEIDQFEVILNNSIDGVADAIDEIQDIEFLGGLRDAEAAGRDRKGALHVIDEAMESLGDTED